ncbi:hypothetical protein MBM_02498 [Drepanopeziza brunnea f. sp. 'multigermtubi' MB_m1]|uniref:Uncharacterized protein n=1 Tax=Marssonina brunnea f. sp. multigermtubi (strain MB_m1) TaxID=1072389 RepID=K1X227_MARBU|nr:uncharacterized protein MBM_02498 [Drepanopeziza brunnea f. sp. 'multigermtubi' MB_m1]EKD19261.1 hypothetical protein MBM_02498 [Drepanopeziza brunnea f. sp. 'multigermtubi' MB_m1]
MAEKYVTKEHLTCCGHTYFDVGEMIKHYEQSHSTFHCIQVGARGNSGKNNQAGTLAEKSLIVAAVPILRSRPLFTGSFKPRARPSQTQLPQDQQSQDPEPDLSQI